MPILVVNFRSEEYSQGVVSKVDLPGLSKHPA